MTGFKTVCNKCGVPIWMAKDSMGKWYPEDLLDDVGSGENHKHIEKSKPSQPQQNLENGGRLYPDAEAQVRVIVREEFARLLALVREIAEAEAKKK